MYSQACSVVIGMHPDQATGSIVEFAMENDKPFAVIPCCVFPRLFPYRFIRESPVQDDAASFAEIPPPPPSTPPTSAASPAPSLSFWESPSPYGSAQERPTYGTGMQRVVTHSQLVRFLMQQSGAETLFLPFEGANQVVYLSRPYSHTYGADVMCCGAIQGSDFGTEILKWIGL
jgi:hypothetical protein